MEGTLRENFIQCAGFSFCHELMTGPARNLFIRSRLKSNIIMAPFTIPNYVSDRLNNIKELYEYKFTFKYEC
jgi:hypothetical protein